MQHYRLPALIASCAAFLLTSTSLLANDFEQIRSKQHQFEDETGVAVACLNQLSSTDCLAGLDNLLQISTSPIFPEDKFTFIFLTTQNTNVDNTGWLNINAAQSPTEMQSYLQSQSDAHIQISQKQNEFIDQTDIDVGCLNNISSVDCIAGLDKLLQISSNQLFPTTHFSFIFLTTQNRDVDNTGWVHVNATASATELAAFLQAQ